MLTNNYTTMNRHMFLGNSSQVFVGTTGNNATLTAAQFNYESALGKYMRYGRCANIPTSIVGSYQTNYAGVFFGSGTTPPSKTDYTLEAPITSGLSVDNPSALIEQHYDNGQYVFISNFVLTNTSNNDISVSEMGLIVPLYGYKSVNGGNVTSVTDWSFALMERTVLDEPVIILPSESKLITYKIIFNQL